VIKGYKLRRGFRVGVLKADSELVQKLKERNNPIEGNGRVRGFLGSSSERGDRNGVGVGNRGKSLVGESIDCDRWEARDCPSPGETRVIRDHKAGW
jgi:hypothetical protein